MVLTAIGTLLTVWGLLHLPVIQGISFPELGAVSAPPVDRIAGSGPIGTSAWTWVDDLFPSNLIVAMARPEAILGLLFATFAFGVAARRLAAEPLQMLQTVAEGVRDSLFVLIRWLIELSPLLLLALGFRFAVTSEFGVGQLMLAYIGLEITAVLVATALLYPVTVLGGRVSLGRFARAVFPAQVVAATTRSSLATIPILLRESAGVLRIPQWIAGLVIPLGGAVFKLSPVVSNHVRLLLLAHVLGISLGPGQIAVFTITILLLTPLTLGIPSVSGGARRIPAYVAVGIPPEYVILLGAATALVDVFLTVLNSTGYLTATALTARLLGSRAEAVDESEGSGREVTEKGLTPAA
jgi:Na+/H+-dicarboxylate symporter